jgi:hypothetical protein
MSILVGVGLIVFGIVVGAISIIGYIFWQILKDWK